ncbi:WD domain, G-beta repeat protein [Teladorsagia circumcincta]|uniref:WD domain, G-beta repeat protein n=1 Tax=Teladorsagia circumcincta TaxID=45464 RepID=A0A2G9V3E1_TELCI|nr:WD domain, G-beta repeat protein [Teladorsagia circumcincta]
MLVTPLDIEEELEHNHTEAHVRIWDSITLTTLHVLGGSKAMFEKAIAALAFSNTDGGNLLACIDDSYQHTLSVWKWSSEVKVVEAKSANDQIFAASWHPMMKNLIVVYGRGHFSFWQFDGKNETLTKNLAIFEGRDKPKTLLSMCFSETGDVITGGVFALCVSRKGTLLSAGKDLTIAEWETTDLVRRRRPVEGDSDDITCCVAVQPHLFITASADGTVRQYDSSTRKRNWRKNYGVLGLGGVPTFLSMQ